VLGKALKKGLHPLVVFNKVDRPASRVGEVEDEVFDLFVSLDATDEQLDFPMVLALRVLCLVSPRLQAHTMGLWLQVYASAKEGWATMDSDLPEDEREDMSCLLDTIVEHVPPPRVLGDASDPFKMLVTQIERDTFVGKLALGRVSSGTVKVGDPIQALNRDGEVLEQGKVTKLFARRGLGPVVLDTAQAGDIVQVAGLDCPRPTDSVVAPSVVHPLYVACACASPCSCGSSVGRG